MAAAGVAAMAVADTADRRAAMVDRAALGQYLNSILSDATIAELPNHYRGKVRDNYDLPDGRRIIIATDRLSAFDRILTAIPLKGQVLTDLARFWFEETRALCPNHVIGYPDPNVLVCRRLDIMPVEIVVRDYLTGSTATSIWPMYKAGRRDIYGIRFSRRAAREPETAGNDHHADHQGLRRRARRAADRRRDRNPRSPDRGAMA